MYITCTFYVHHMYISCTFHEHHMYNVHHIYTLLSSKVDNCRASELQHDAYLEYWSGNTAHRNFFGNTI